MRFFELAALVMDHKFLLKVRLSDKPWLLRLAYLTDISININEVTLSLQAKHITIFVVNDNIRDF